MAFPDTIVLAGGLGTRIRSVLGDLPKVLAPVAGRPFLDHLLVQLAGAGCRHVTFATGHGADRVEAHLETLREQFPNVGLSISHETTALGTGGAIRNALGTTASEDLAVMNGDSYVDADLAALAALHTRKEAQATMTLVHVNDAGRYGTVRIDPEGRVISFAEKSGNSGESATINAGAYIFRRSVFEQLHENTNISLEYDVLPKLCGFGLYGCVQDAPFIDIGTPDTLAAADLFIGRLQARGHR